MRWRGEADVLGTDAKDDGLVGARGERGVVEGSDGEAEAEGDELEAGGGALEAAFEEVHGRRAEEAGDEEVGRFVVDRARRADLLKDAGAQDGEAIAEEHGFGLVVGDVEHGGAETPMERSDLAAQLGAQGGVEGGERLVKEEGGGAADERRAPGRRARRSPPESAAGGAGGDSAMPSDWAASSMRAAICGGGAAELEAEGQVAADAQVWIERLPLKDHGNVARGAAAAASRRERRS